MMRPIDCDGLLVNSPDDHNDQLGSRNQFENNRGSFTQSDGIIPIGCESEVAGSMPRAQIQKHPRTAVPPNIGRAPRHISWQVR